MLKPPILTHQVGVYLYIPTYRSICGPVSEEVVLCLSCSSEALRSAQMYLHVQSVGSCVGYSC